MNRLLAILFALLAACAAVPAEPPVAPAEVQRLAQLAVAPASLYRIELPAGDSGSINVGWWNNGATVLDPKTWLDDGDDTDTEPDDFDGVRFVGKGVGVTHIRCTSWDGITIAVKQHEGIVQFENLTIHTGSNQGTQFGEQNLEKKLSPKFGARLIDCEVVADVIAGQRPKWLVFGYQADLYMSRVTLRGKQAVEHDVYFHGFADKGAIVEDCIFESAGAEGFKVRPDMTETVAVPGASIIIRRCKFYDWRQDWSWRGGAAIVIQGGASGVLIDGCLFKGGTPTAVQPANDRSHAIEIVAESNSHGGEFGNGDVVIRNCALSGRSDVDWNNSILRVARNSGAQMAARSVTIEGCGIYGAKMLVVVGQVPSGKTVIRGCNTPEIAARLRTVLDTHTEATIPTSSRRMPVSEGRIQ